MSEDDNAFGRDGRSYLDIASEVHSLMEARKLCRGGELMEHIDNRLKDLLCYIPAIHDK
jgi:hypothetical protein